jgi:hypothetical protein
MRKQDMPKGYVLEEYVGQILDDGQWLDYARGTEQASRTWQENDPVNRRVVHWINRHVLIPPTVEGESPDLTVLIEGVRVCALEAQAALADEAEGRLRAAVMEMHAHATTIKQVVETW